MKKIWAILRRDLTADQRDAMIVYILVIPFVIALLLNLLTSSVTNATLHVAVEETVGADMVNTLKNYAQVETVATREALKERISRLDDVYGVEKTAEGYKILRQGNEQLDMTELLKILLNAPANAELPSPLTVKISDVGWKLSPIKQYGGNLLCVFISVFGAMVILINLVEEKQENTLAAMNVTPVRRWQYVTGKAILGFILPILHGLGILLILNYGQVNYLQAALVIFAIALTSVTVGFAIGVETDNILGAISGMKMMFVPILGSVFGAIYLQERLQVLLYWSPFYWAFKILDKIILQTATWPEVFSAVGIIVALSAAVMLLLLKKIRRGLN